MKVESSGVPRVVHAPSLLPFVETSSFDIQDCVLGPVAAEDVELFPVAAEDAEQFSTAALDLLLLDSYADVLLEVVQLEAVAQPLVLPRTVLVSVGHVPRLLEGSTYRDPRIKGE